MTEFIRKKIDKLGQILLVAGIAVLFISALHIPALAQQGVVADSSQLVDDAELYYSVGKSRLVRWVRALVQTAPKDVLDQILEMMQSAQRFADQGDFETAQIFLDTALSLADRFRPQTTEQNTAESGWLASPGPKFTPEIITGVDLWQQEFEMTFLDDTTFIERAGNPYTGMRLTGDLPSETFGATTTDAAFRVSRDYYNADASFRTIKGSYQGNHWLAESRLEWTSYRDTLGLTYLQYSGKLRGGLSIAKDAVFYAGLDWRVRRYGAQSEFYPNYLHGMLYAGLEYTSGLQTRLAGRYSLASRKHADYPLDDYEEHVITASVYQTTATNSSVFLENVYRIRLYAGGGNDSTFQNPYTEEYARADFRFGLTPSLSFDVQADLTLRQHHFPSLVTPDYLDVTANPRFLLRLWQDWQLGLGYLYKLRVYSSDIIRTTPLLPVTDVDRFNNEQNILGYEDYYSHGISLSLELFRLGALMINLSNNLEYRTYPNSQTNDLEGFALFSNRQVNSTFLFLTWRFVENMQVNLFANLDEDRSRVRSNNDSRNTLFSLELAYRF